MSEKGGSLLKLVDVCKSYENSSGQGHLTILENVSLELQHGESVAIVGPSGCGKSTLLNIIGTLDHPTSGQVFLEEQALNGLNAEKIAAIRNGKIGFIFQSHHLLPQCTVWENVLLPTLAGSQSHRNEATERGQKLLERVGLSERLRHRPGQLSGGERQRVAVVRALINQPKLLLADEPTGALDGTSSRNLAELLEQLNHEYNVTLILVTHAVELAARMQRRFELRDGKLTEQ